MEQLKNAKNIKFIANPDGYNVKNLFQIDNKISSNYDTKYIILGNLMDSTSESGIEFLDTKIYNIRNIITCISDNNYYLILGPRDLNKIKLLPLSFINLKEYTSANDAEKDRKEKDRKEKIKSRIEIMLLKDQYVSYYNEEYIQGKTEDITYIDKDGITKTYTQYNNTRQNIEYIKYFDTIDLNYPKSYTTDTDLLDLVNVEDHIEFVVDTDSFRKNFYPFWIYNNTGFNIIDSYENGNLRTYMFLARFIEIFKDIDGLNLIFTIPIELDFLGNENILKDLNNKRLAYNDTDYNRCFSIKDYAKKIYEKYNKIFKENEINMPLTEFEKKILNILAYYTLKLFNLMLSEPSGRIDHKKYSQKYNNEYLRGILKILYYNKTKFIHTYNKDNIRCILSYGGLNKKLAANGVKSLQKIYDELNNLQELQQVLSNMDKHNGYDDNRVNQIKNSVLAFLDTKMSNQNSDSYKKLSLPKNPSVIKNIMYGGYNFDKNKVKLLDVNLDKICIEINNFLLKIVDKIFEDYSTMVSYVGYKEYNINLLFLMLMIENFKCDIRDYKDIKDKKICLQPFDEKNYNQIFSSRHISPIVSDIFSIRYNHDETDCFLNKQDPMIIQITGHANNYVNNNPYKLLQNDSLIYGTLIDLYGKYDMDYKTFVICLDNSSFFNSVLENNYESRAIFSYSYNEGQDFAIDDPQGLSYYNSLEFYKIQTKISLYREYTQDIIPDSKDDKNNKFIINNSLFDALVDFSRLKKYNHLNYYGSQNNNIYVSNVISKESYK